MAAAHACFKGTLRTTAVSWTGATAPATLRLTAHRRTWSPPQAPSRSSSHPFFARSPTASQRRSQLAQQSSERWAGTAAAAAAAAAAAHDRGHRTRCGRPSCPADCDDAQASHGAPSDVPVVRAAALFAAGRSPAGAQRAAGIRCAFANGASMDSGRVPGSGCAPAPPAAPTGIALPRQRGLRALAELPSSFAVADPHDLRYVVTIMDDGERAAAANTRPVGQGQARPRAPCTPRTRHLYRTADKRRAGC